MSAIRVETPTRAESIRVLMGPPGVLFWIVVVLALLAGVDTNSRKSFTGLLVVIPLWFAIAGWWLVRFGWRAFAVGTRSSIRAWSAWFLVPAAMGLVFLLVQANVPYGLRLELSRSGMDTAATEIMAGGTTDRSWIGLYGASDVERIPSGFRFVVADDGLGRWGYAYTTDPAGPRWPDEADDPDAGLWTNTQFESAGGRWWRWSESWD